MNKIQKYFFNRLIRKFDSLCGTLSSTYNFPDEAFQIRIILEKLVIKLRGE